MAEPPREVLVADSCLEDIDHVMMALGDVTGFNPDVIRAEAQVSPKLELALTSLATAAERGDDVSAKLAEVLYVKGMAYGVFSDGMAVKDAGRQKHDEWLAVSIDAYERSVAILPVDTALLALGRAQRKSGRTADALATLRRTEREGGSSSAGIQATKMISEMEARGTGELPAPTKSGCFIATACYGSYDHPDVLVLRRYRDETLARSAIGRSLIASYYVVAPRLARRLATADRAASWVRLIVLRPLVRLICRSTDRWRRV